MPFLEAGVLACSAVIFFMTAMAAIFAWRRNVVGVFGVQVVGMMLFVSMVTFVLMPTMAPVFSTQELAEEFGKQYDGVSTVHVQKFLQPGLAFYAGVFGPEFKTGEQLSALLGRQASGYVVVQRKMYEKLPAQDRQKLMELATVSDKMLLRIR